jgi:hypothetical protein
MQNDQTALIRALNDLLREHRLGGLINVTAGIAACGDLFIAQALNAISTVSRFDEADDPYGEHDFGAVEVDGRRLFWKIDYYDETLTYGADDPSDLKRCRRVLTIMLADEY